MKVVGTDEWTVVSPRFENTSSSGNWTRPSYDLSPYADQELEVAFYFYSQTTGYQNRDTRVAPGWYIDEVEIQTGALPSLPALEGFEGSDALNLNSWIADRGVWEVGMPTSGPEAAHEADNVLPPFSVATTRSGGLVE